MASTNTYGSLKGKRVGLDRHGNFDLGRGKGKMRGSWSVQIPMAQNYALSNIVAGNQTLLPGQLTSGHLFGPAQGGNVNWTMPTAVDIVSVFEFPTVNSAIQVWMFNSDNADTITVLTAAGVTLSGTMTIAPGVLALFILKLTNVTVGAQAVTLTRVNG